MLPLKVEADQTAPITQRSPSSSRRIRREAGRRVEHDAHRTFLTVGFSGARPACIVEAALAAVAHLIPRASERAGRGTRWQASAAYLKAFLATFDSQTALRRLSIPRPVARLLALAETPRERAGHRRAGARRWTSSAASALHVSRHYLPLAHPGSPVLGGTAACARLWPDRVTGLALHGHRSPSACASSSGP